MNVARLQVVFRDILKSECGDDLRQPLTLEQLKAIDKAWTAFYFDTTTNLHMEKYAADARARGEAPFRSIIEHVGKATTGSEGDRVPHHAFTAGEDA